MKVLLTSEEVEYSQVPKTLGVDKTGGFFSKETVGKVCEKLIETENEIETAVFEVVKRIKTKKEELGIDCKIEFNLEFGIDESTKLWVFSVGGKQRICVKVII